MRRFWEKVDQNGPVFDDPLSVVATNCWLWLARVSQKGYGQFKVDGRAVQAHRFAWELENGPFPEGLVSDHLCRVRRCVRPSHIEPVTPQENTARGLSPVAVVLQSGLCQRGHDDWVQRCDGFRSCRTCQNEGQRRRWIPRSSR